MIFAHLLLLSAVVLPPAAPASAGHAPIILAFGDSLTSGHGIGRGQAYPAVPQTKLDGGNYADRVVNAGISGETTSDGVRRIDRALVPGTQILILGLGANDGLRGVPIATVHRNLETIIQRAEQKGIAVVLCGMEAPPLHGLQYKGSIRRFITRVQRVASGDIVLSS